MYSVFLVCSAKVAPFVGAWIEIILSAHLSFLLGVAPFVGAWIEISICSSNTFLVASHPLWVRGLKFWALNHDEDWYKVAPFVGAWIEIGRNGNGMVDGAVAPFVGAWIEICSTCSAERTYQSRTLCGCVD